MKVSIIGTGYVGLVTGACLADVGNHVVCVDLDQRKIDMLERGEIPIHEPGLAEIVRANAASGRLRFTTDPVEGARFGTIQMIAVGTPPGEDGSADLQYVLAAARGIAAHMDGPRVVVDKSTVPVGTADKVHEAIKQGLAQRKASHAFSVVSNPEFLKEGAAIEDFMRPDRIIIGADDPDAIARMRELYQPFQRNHDRLQVMDIRSAELTKYAANAMLATRISFMNELALLAERLGADIEHVRVGIGSDPRIGYHFLYPGTGYGGSCFPKDVTALLRIGQEQGIDLKVVRAVEEANDRQKEVLVQKIVKRFGENLAGRHFAIWGLAFKPNTDDMREAPSRVVIAGLLARGATVSAFDPVAMDEARKAFAGQKGITFAASAAECAKGADAVVIVTEWKQFRSPDFEALRAGLKQPVIFDGRNLYEPAAVREQGIEYHPIGR
ncbi:UDP-glucose dehydrogenase family protein [Usitatibacter palustris]|uniref:UDP-glucose 6-dehydrogenase n=1 Tax=Usitatibacter palustris TaxID=2732487 RepID=A0A6M4H8M3_9PROT|nr:UDP-glucose/GDP-mannose dehydrogenase family protein [Usitatibacter palustris]QJR15535.1 UDP-glucose 6-dehydrogenase [Usitatibacter palustris]